MRLTDAEYAAALDALARGDSVRTVALRYDVTERTVQRWRLASGQSRGQTITGSQRAREDVYASAPSTTAQRMLYRAWRKRPSAKLAELAAEAFVTVSYASRLSGHWRSLSHTEGQQP